MCFETERARLQVHHFVEIIEPTWLVESLEHPQTAASPHCREEDTFPIRRQAQPDARIAVACGRKVLADFANNLPFLTGDIKGVQNTSIGLGANSVQTFGVLRKRHLNCPG